MTFPKTCFNPNCKCKELKIVREVTVRCSNCHCGVKVDEKRMERLELLFTVDYLNLSPDPVHDGKDNT